MLGAAEGCRIAGWYFKSVEAAIFATAASQGVTQGLSVGVDTSLTLALAYIQHPCIEVVITVLLICNIRMRWQSLTWTRACSQTSLYTRHDR